MRIIEWNCQGGFRHKNERILSFNPDIIIVTECENPERLKFGKLTPIPNYYYWYGSNKHKGIAILSYSDYRVELLSQFNPKYRYVLPFKVSNGEHSFTLIAIWAMPNKENRAARYIGQVWFAINEFPELLTESTMLIGDFNSNKIWDKKYRTGNHTDVVNLLLEHSIESAYHFQNEIEHGEEPDPTFFLQKKIEKPYHIDYCFASRNVLNNISSFKIGKFDEWIDISDHVPLFIETNNGW